MTIAHADVVAAAERLAGRLILTPTVKAAALSAEIGVDLYVKLETLQRTGAFKERGALNRLMNLSEEEKSRGVIAMSAGNHAQGVALHARALGIPATIVMPRHTPFVKVGRTEAFGARVVLQGDTVAESYAHAQEIAQAEERVFVHPYDDPAIIAGQGTIALEMLDAVPDLDDLVVPIGGGGLIAGMTIAARAVRPDIRITGIQSHAFPSVVAALSGHESPMPVTGGSTLAEGIAVKEPGGLTVPIIRDHGVSLGLVDEAAIEQAVHSLASIQNLVVEGAGAAGLAAVLSDPTRYKGRKVGLVLCGGNIDPRILSSILMRGLVLEGRLTRLRVRVEDQPGALSRASALIGEEGGNIVEVVHRRLTYAVPVKRLDVEFLVETRDRHHVDSILNRLSATRLEATVLDDLG